MITDKELYEYHEIFNYYFFSGMLSRPQIVTSKKFKKDHCWGYFLDPNIIGITINDKSVFTLLHEMIHQYQGEFNIIGKDHGKLFQSFAARIEDSLGLDYNSVRFIDTL